ncbi:MAG: hypothetical protein AAF231_12210 [Pseudomonadota bacterium]
MGLAREHELHKRRFSRNLGLGLALVGLVAVVFGLTVVKVSTEEFTEPLSTVPFTGADAEQ